MSDSESEAVQPVDSDDNTAFVSDTESEIGDMIPDNTEDFTEHITGVGENVLAVVSGQTNAIEKRPEYVKPSNPRMTRYEFARILGLRISTLTASGPTTLSESHINLLDRKIQQHIAELELALGVCPEAIIRRFPNGHIENVRTRDLQIDERLFCNDIRRVMQKDTLKSMLV